MGAGEATRSASSLIAKMLQDEKECLLSLVLGKDISRLVSWPIS